LPVFLTKNPKVTLKYLDELSIKRDYLAGVTRNESANGKRIDPHVHCRDWAESRKATIRETMELARSQGIVAIIDMPNTCPPIITKELVKSRIITAETEGCGDGYYLYIGATANAAQLRGAFDLAKYHPRVAGMKLVAGKTTGALEITEEDDQRLVFRTAKELGYDGVIAAHAEKEKLAQPKLWIPQEPWTWNLAKPPEMEVEAVRDLIKFAKEEGFEGHLHICHISVPEAVQLVIDAKNTIRISCGLTPHHGMLSTEDMHIINGMRYKVNPPLRSLEMVAELRKHLRKGHIDIIETDHAPHTKEEKTFDPSRPDGPYMSGIRSLEKYAAFLGHMFLSGLEVTKEQIEDMTYWNIKKIFPKIRE
jgi:dihydroorotase